MADGSLRKIEDVRAGDMVRNAKTVAAVRVGKVIEGPEALPLIRFGFDGATLTTSQAHPVLTAVGLTPANQLKKGDTVFDAQGNPHPVTILETLSIEEGQRVINVNLDAASSDADERLKSPTASLQETSCSRACWRSRNRSKMSDWARRPLGPVSSWGTARALASVSSPPAHPG